MDLYIEFQINYKSRRKKYKATSTFYFLTRYSVNGDFTFIIEALDREMSHILGDGWKVKFHSRYGDITTQ